MVFFPPIASQNLGSLAKNRKIGKLFPGNLKSEVQKIPFFNSSPFPLPHQPPINLCPVIPLESSKKLMWQIDFVEWPRLDIDNQNFGK